MPCAGERRSVPARILDGNNEHLVSRTRFRTTLVDVLMMGNI